ncbi:MAG: hypothetical protein KDC95_04490 [Planctomycetes bacterium]|nr:hypothetical protein [Planctomycetota bacterium]
MQRAQIFGQVRAFSAERIDVELPAVTDFAHPEEEQVFGGGGRVASGLGRRLAHAFGMPLVELEYSDAT